MTANTGDFRKVRLASAVDSFGTGMVAGTVAVLVATREGLGALGLILSVRIVAALGYSIWARYATRGTGELRHKTHAPAVILMVLSSVFSLATAVAGSPTWLMMLAYFAVATTNSAAGLHISVRAPHEAYLLGAQNAGALAVASSLAAIVYAVGGGGVLLGVGMIVAVAQLIEIPLLRSVQIDSAQKDTNGGSSWRWGLLAFAVSAVSYGPLALAGGIVAREFSPAWVAPALLSYAAASLVSVRIGSRYKGVPLWVLGVWMFVANLANVLVLVGVYAYIIGRLLVSVLMYTVDGTLRVRAFAIGGTRALVAVGVGGSAGVAVAIVSFGYVAEHVSVPGAALWFAGAALGMAAILRTRAVRSLFTADTSR